MEFTVCFVVHAGEIEIKSSLLAGSLRTYWPQNIKIIACVPQNGQMKPSAFCEKFLSELDVRMHTVINPIGHKHPLGNKIKCLDIPCETNRIIFLDSDILLTAPAIHSDLITNLGFAFNAKPADCNTSRLDTTGWLTLYKHFGIPPPTHTQIQTTVSNEIMMPYFNSGVLAVNSNCGIGETWALIAMQLAKIRPDLLDIHIYDQIPLSLAIYKNKHEINLLSDEWNYPCHLKKVKDIPKLAHYHWPKVIRKEDCLLNSLKKVLERFPMLRTILEKHENWQDLSV
jgi:hypothetical protein